MGCRNAQSPCTLQRPSCTSPRHPCSLAKNGKWGERTAQAPRPSPSFAVLPNTASSTSPPRENWQCWGNGERRGQEPEGASGWVCGGISVSLPLYLPAPRAQDFVPHSLLTVEGELISLSRLISHVGVQTHCWRVIEVVSSFGDLFLLGKFF